MIKMSKENVYQEKENIYIYSGNGDRYYRINVNTGEMFGQTGRKLTSVKQVAKALDLYLALVQDNLSLPLALAVGACQLCSFTTYPEDADTKNLSDSLTTLYSITGHNIRGLSLSCLRNHVRDLRDYAPYTKYFKKVWELTDKKYNGLMPRTKINNWFSGMDEYIKGYSIYDCPMEDIRKIMPEEYHNSFNCFTAGLNLTNLSKEETDAILYYGVKQKIFAPTFAYTGLKDYLAKYISYCRDMNKKPNKTASFTREFVETEREWQILKTEIDNKKIVANYARKAKFWDFMYGDFIVKIPTCGKDLITEGQLMHHCVGSYVNNIVNGSTYICFIRHKDNPDKPYITCQIDPKTARIDQYFLAYDKYISSKEDKEFKEAYQKYLYSVKKEL